MPAGGRIQLNLRKREASTETKPSMLLTIEDNGPGIPPEALENIFDTGYTTRTGEDKKPYDWPATHRGLGLSITRSIIEAASGRIYATNRSQSGARFEIELPVNNR
jgi:two-component system sensor histidine kinase ChvG